MLIESFTRNFNFSRNAPHCLKPRLLSHKPFLLQIVKANLRQRLFSDASIVDPVQWIVSDVNTGRVITSKQIRYVHTCKIHLKKRKAHGAAERAKTDTERLGQAKMEAEGGGGVGEGGLGGAGGGCVGGGEGGGGVAAAGAGGVEAAALKAAGAEVLAKLEAALVPGQIGDGDVKDVQAAVTASAAAAAAASGSGQAVSSGEILAGVAAAGTGTGPASGQAVSARNINAEPSQVRVEG